MRKLFSILSVLFTVVVLGNPGNCESRLSEFQKATLYGGAPTKTGTCCFVIDVCKVASDSCSNYNTLGTTCPGKNQIVLQGQYSKSCQPPDVANPNYDCKDYQTDINDKMYYCVAAFVCNYNTMTSICSAGAADFSKCVYGYYDCASNCTSP